MSTKKKRKSARRKGPSTPPKFVVGDAVRFKYGTSDADYPDIPLGGWAGTIAEISHDQKSHLYLTEWNQLTLDDMPPIFRKRCERDGLHIESYWAREDDIEPDVGDRLPLEQPTNIQTRPLRMTVQDDRIRAVFGLTSDDPLPDSIYENVCRYHVYLAANLTFPFEAAYWKKTGPFVNQKCKITVVKLVDLDGYCYEDHGLLFQIEQHGTPTTVVQTKATNRHGLFGVLSQLLGLSAMPDEHEGEFLSLSDLELGKKDANQQLLKDFDYWLWNY